MPSHLDDGSDHLTYNGVGIAFMKSNLHGTPVYDSAERAVIGMKWLIHVSGYVIADPDPAATTDAQWEEIRIKLSKPGGRLKMESKGFGNLTVNGGEKWDSAWGPKPRLLNFAPLGPGKASIIEYELEVQIPECENATFKRAVAALCFCHGTTFDIDGFLEISTTGTIEIPITRNAVNSRTLPDHVDEYLPRVVPAVRPGFQRVRAHTQRSEDGRKLTFEFVDQQQPTPLQEFCTRADITHELKSSIKKGLFVWEGTISANITLAAGQPKSNTYNLFMAIVSDRIADSRTATAVRVGDVVHGAFRHGAIGTVPQVAAGLVMLNDFWMRNNVTGRNAEYRVDYRILHVYDINQLFQKHRVFHPLPGTNWNQWRVSLDESVNRPRGHADFRVNRNNETIIDLCLAQPPSTSRLSGGGMFDVLGVTDKDLDVPRFPKGEIKGLRVQPEQSWLFYDVGLRYVEDGPGRYTRSKPMGADTNSNQQGSGQDDLKKLQKATVQDVSSATTSIPDNIHETATPSAKIYLFGKAIRLGHAIPTPKLAKFGGANVFLNRVVAYSQHRLSRYGDLDIIECYFCLEYLLDRPPEGPPPLPANPYLAR